METFQDLSLPIPGKEDLAKLHSSIHQSAPVKAGVCTDGYAAQGWISYIMESIRRYSEGVVGLRMNKGKNELHYSTKVCKIERSFLCSVRMRSFEI